MTWVEFDDEAAFKTVHDRICADLGIPRPGQNQATGKTDLAACWTTAYAVPVMDNHTGKLLVNIDAEVAATYKLPTRPAPVPVKINGTDVLPVTQVAFEVAKPLPATWVVDGQVVAVPVKPAVATPVDTKPPR